MPTPVANGLDLKNAKIINLGQPSTNTDAATKAYVDAAIRGLDWKSSVRAAASGNITVTAPGASIDGVTLTAGDRVLLLGQTTGSENGIYTWNGAAVAMTRAGDADENAEVTSGLAVTSTEGTVNGDKMFVLITNDPITVGTTALTFTQVGSASSPYTAGNGLSLIGQQFAAVVKSGGGLGVDSGGIFADFSVLVRDFNASIGDGSATSITVTHNFGTLDVDVSLTEVATGQQWIPDVTSRTTNTVVLAFASAPAANAFRARVQA